MSNLATHKFENLMQYYTGCDRAISSPVEKRSIVKFLKSCGIESLWHVTSMANADSISNHGLLSAMQLNNRKIDCTFLSTESSRAMDQRYGKQDFIHVALYPFSPNLYVFGQSAKRSGHGYLMLELDVEILLESNTSHEIYMQNAIKAGTQPINLSTSHAQAAFVRNHITAQKWKTIYNFDEAIKEQAKSAAQAEILISRFIDLKHVKSHKVVKG